MASADVTLAPRARAPWRDALRQLVRHRLAAVSLVFLVVVGLLALLAPLVAKAGYAAIEFAPLQRPSAAHPMGTDELGRDVWSRVVYGARISLAVGLGSQALAATIGIVVGAVAGFYGRALDTILMRLTDMVLALPPILLALLFLTAFGGTAGAVLLAIGLSTWPVIARVTRSRVLALKQQEFVEAAYSIGCSPRRVLVSHVLPGIWGAVIVQVTFGVSYAIFTEAFLGFVGLGPQPPTPSWGRLIVDGFQYVRTSPHLVLYPAGALTLTLLAFNFLGDGLRDALDPRGSTR